MSDDVVLVANPYRAELVAQKAASGSVADRLRQVLDKAITAFEAGAWVGPTGGASDQAYTQLTDDRDQARSTADAVEDEFDYAIAGQPQQVSINSWQVHRHQIGV